MNTDARRQARPAKPTASAPFLTTNYELRTTNSSSGFTLIEALVSIAIAAGLILVLATLFRQTSTLQRQTAAGARASQVVRTVFDMIGRDLMGLSRRGLLMIRAQAADGRYDDRDRILLAYDEDGDPIQLESARTDILVLLTSGYQTSATNNDRVSNFARVIWSQSERINGVDLDSGIGGRTNESSLRQNPKFWGANQVLARHQTLCIPDPLSATAPWSSYRGDLPGGSWAAKSAYNNRGPDYFNMGLPDVVRYFDGAMIGSPKYGQQAVSHFLFGTRWTSWSNELHPFRYAAKVMRIGRSGTSEAGTVDDGTSSGREGGGDLSRSMVNGEDAMTLGDMRIYYGYPIGIYDQANDSFRGYERPRVYGPQDYHRIASFGVAAFQVDWADGRRMPEGSGKTWAFYPIDGCRSNNTNARDGYRYNYLGGPGRTHTYAWGYFSPTTVRDSLLRKQGRGSIGLWGYYSEYKSYVGAYGVPQSGSFPYGRDAWCWPKALRIRIVLLAPDAAQPVPFVFERVFYLNIQ